MQIIKKHNINIIVATNGQQAFNKYSSEPSSVQLILMDINMPVMGGNEASQKIRAFEEENNVQPKCYICGVTGHQIDSDFFRHSMQSKNSINDYVQKPVDCHYLTALIKEIYSVSP